MKYRRAAFLFSLRCMSLALLLWFGGQMAAAQSQDTEEPPQNDTAHFIYIPNATTPQYVYLPTIFYPQPPVIENPHPADKSIRQSLNAYLTWDILDPELENAVYTIYLEANNEHPSVVIADGLSELHFDPATFLEDTQYYWQVVATAPAGKRFESSVWTFRTDYFPYPPEVDSMVRVPAGEFQMGCDADNSGYQCFSNQVPLHAVYLDAFEIDKFEVTNKQYRACVEAGICNLPRKTNSRTRSSYFYNPEYDYYPVIFVSNWDARAYCGWVGKRLPTEAEWEKASRGAIDIRPWPWGDDPFDCSRANHNCLADTDTDRVDRYPAGQSPYGVMNISGNVWEWVQDYYDDNYYKTSPYYNPVNTVQTQRYPFFSVRGGCFRNSWWYLRSSHRSGGHWGDTAMDDAPLFRSNMYGIRCARSVTDSSAAEPPSGN